MTTESRHRLIASSVLALLVLVSLMALVPGMRPTDIVGARTAEKEPNSDMGLANQLTAGESYVGSLDGGGDPEDWYKIYVERGLVLNVTIHMDSPSLNADLEIYHEYVAGVTDRKWSMTGYEYETICMISVKDNFYYVRVFVREGTGQYTLNADVSEAPVLEAGDRVSGALYNNSYRVMDFYRVWLECRGNSTDLLTAVLDTTPIEPAEEAWLNLRILRLYEWNVGIRWYDISWGHHDREVARAAASGTGWYYIRINAYNGSGNYDLEVAIDETESDGNDRLSDAVTIYGPGIKGGGGLNQSTDHRDCYGVHLHQGESLELDLTLIYPMDAPSIFSVTILRPDRVLIGEWTNYHEGSLDISIQADMDRAPIEGLYTIIVELKVAVEAWNPVDISDHDGTGSYYLEIDPSGHNSAPETVSGAVRAEMEEDRSLSMDVSDHFRDDDMDEGDVLTYSYGGLTVISGGPLGNQSALDVQVDRSTVVMTPLPDWSGSGILKLEATDIFGARATLSIYFEVTPVNDPPMVDEDLLSLELQEWEEIRPVDLDDVFHDTDLVYDDFLTFSLEGNDSLPAWIDARGRLVLGPVEGQGQEQWMTVTATDSEGARATLEVVVKVEDAEHPPALRKGRPTMVVMNEDGSAELDLYTIFADADPEDSRLSFRWTGNLDVRPLLDDEGILTLSVVENWSGNEYLNITAEDHSGLTARAEVKVRVRPVPDTPRLVSMDPSPAGEVRLDGDSFTLFMATVSDNDTAYGDTLHFIWTVDDRFLSSTAGRHLALEEAILSNGTHVLNLTVMDRDGLKAVATWNLLVDRPAPEPVVRAPGPTETTVSGGLAFGIWALFVVLATEPGRYAVLKFLWVPLYTKIGKEEVLDQFVRGRIYGYIEHNPGVNYTEIKRKMGIGNGTLTHHLNMLQKENYIKAQRDGIYKRFYPKEYSVDRDTVHMSEIQREIFFHVKTNPDISQKALSKKIGVSKRVISYHVKHMAEAGLLDVRRKGRRHALKVAGEV